MSELKRAIEEHKKCPCCDSEDTSVGSVVVLDREELYIKCNSCGLKLQIRKEYGYGELLKRWNTRKPMERIVERLEQQAKQYRRRCNELVEKGYIPMADKQLGKACSYEHAIEIVKEEGGA